MKTLHFVITIVILPLILVPMLNVSGMMTPESKIQLLTGKPTYVPGEKIQIIGAFNPNDLIHIDLVNPFDGTKNSTLLQSDNTGHFRTNYVVPYDAVNGTWKILATSGLNHASLDIQVTSSNYGINKNTAPIYGPGGPATTIQLESPLRQFKSGIPADEVICKQGLQLVIKTKDSSPACIKPDSAYMLIYRGWAKEFIQAVTWTNQSTCEGTKIPSGDYRKNIFPVLIMSSNSTATVCVTYNFMSDWQSYPNKDVYPHGILETCCFVHPGWYSSLALSNKFEILANPPLFNVTGVMNNSKISVTYKIYAKSDSEGFYDTSVPFDGCLSYPLVVGHDTSEVDATKFHVDFAVPCFATIDDVDSVNIVSGMTYKEIQFP